ncbi:MAG: hypothetical protein M5U09_16790 [Gammaproteobacteria bacterium]|nr:hypothetical protein [Gammaproteobacteria bacterium]
MPYAGFVGVGMGGNSAFAEADNVISLSGIDLPVLDLYGENDFESVLDSAGARAAAQAENGDYRQLVIPGANHFFDGHDEPLIEAVADWLDARTGIVSPTPAKRSALDAFADEERAAEGVVGLEVVETRFEGYLNLRLDPADGDLAAAAAEVLGIALPTVPNTVVDGHGVTVYWLGPDEWLLRTPSEDDRGLAGKLEERLGGLWHSMTDVSGGMAHLALAGPASPGRAVPGA